MMKKPDFLHVDRDSWKLEVGVDIGVDVVRNGCGHSVNTDSRKLKVTLTILWWSLSKRGLAF